jgi:hypothetical protein
MRRRALGWTCIATAVLLVVWIATRTAGADARARSVTERLLGPIADLAATLQWVRVDEAENAGRRELADARAAIALDISPGDPSGWIYYGQHLIYDRGSPLRETDPLAREHWVRAGLALLERGEKECRHPGRVAFARGAVYLALASADDADRPLPMSRVEALDAAADAFARAAAEGEPLAAEVGARVRQEAADERRARSTPPPGR